MTNRPRTISTILAAAFALIFPLFSQQARGAVMYTVTDLGTLPGDSSSWATGINNLGQVVGVSGPDNAFIYSGGQMQKLGNLPGYDYSHPYAINISGQVVGGSGSYNLSAPGLAFLYSGGQMQYLGSNHSVQSFAYGINDSGQAVVSEGGEAFLYAGGQLQDLGFSGTAFGINNTGQIVGVNPSNHAFLYTAGVLQDLGVPENWGRSMGDSINNAGVVVGNCNSQTGGMGYNGAFSYSNSGGWSYLGTLGGIASYAEGINNNGQIVGYSETASGDFHAFVYGGFTMTDINTLIDPSSGWTLQGAYGINDLGQIVGYGLNSAGQSDAFLLTPVPEPATVALLALGGGWIFRRRRSQTN